MSFYGQNDTISVVKTSNIAVVSADKMNVVYFGIKNSISISVPNIKSLNAIAAGLTKISDGKYSLFPNNNKEVEIKIEFINEKGILVNEIHIFKVKVFPILLATINDKNCEGCIVKMTKSDLKSAKISVKVDDYFDYLNIKVKEFNIIFPIKLIGSDGISVDKIEDSNKIIGNHIDKETLLQIDKLSLGSFLYINNIIFTYDDPNLLICKITPITIMLVDENLKYDKDKED